MSYWIDVPCPPANAPADANFLLPVFHATGLADLRPVDGIASLQAWPGKSVQMYRDLRSCRSVEIEVPPERTSVRIIIRAMPSAVDRDLAIALALACAEKLGSSTVKPEMFD